MSLGECLRDVGYEAVDAMRHAHGRWSLTRSDEMAWNAGLHAGHIARVGVQHAGAHLLGNQSENVWGGTGINPIEMVRHAVFQQWMAHEGHRYNLLDEGRSYMGLGVHIMQTSRCLYYVTLVFRGA